MKHSFTLLQFQEAVNKSLSIRSLLQNLNLACWGGNYRTVERFALQHNVDLSHFKGKLIRKGTQQILKRATQDYLSNQFPIDSFRLKKRLLREGLMKPSCSMCELDTWLNRAIPLELDHIDGNHENNNLANLRLLCPNCHSTTSTYRGKNKKCVRRSVV